MKNKLSKVILNIKELSIKDNIPLIEDDILNFLLFYLPQLNEINNILEIGTGYGFSSAIFRHCYPNSKITTIERNKKNYDIASNLLSELDIKVKNENASDYEHYGNIDLLFLDGAKSHYKEFLLKFKKNLNKKSIIISDNVFARGLTFGDDIPKRHRTIHRNMNDFIDEIFKEEYDSYILPIGDGLAITRFR